jgi:hypothetical protein
MTASRSVSVITESEGTSSLRATSSVETELDSRIIDCPQLCPRTHKDNNHIVKDAKLDILVELPMFHATKGRRGRAICGKFALTPL